MSLLPFCASMKDAHGGTILGVRLLLRSLAVHTAWACSCLPLGVYEDAARAESAPPRYAETFAAKEFWKGKRAKEGALYVVEPGTDCVGAQFSQGVE
jgi:hypothetical protein